MSGVMEGGDPGGRVLGRAPSITVGLAEAELRATYAWDPKETYPLKISRKVDGTDFGCVRIQFNGF